MKSLLLILLLTWPLVLTKVVPTCPLFTCNTKSPFLVPKNENKCLIKTSVSLVSDFEIIPCPLDPEMSCAYNFNEKFSYCVKSPYTPLNSLYPGEKCSDPKYCLSNKCEESVCKGLAEEAECEADYECDKGMHCFNKKCAKWAVLGQECGVGNNKCASWLACGNQKCVEPGSIKLEEQAIDALACEEMTSLIGVCVKAATLEGADDTIGNAKRCIIENKCVYHYGVIQKETECICGINDSGHSFCPPGKGDILLEVETYLNFMKEYKPDCHISKPGFCNTVFDTMTKKTEQAYYKAYTAYKQISQGILFLGNTDCIKSTLTSDYWDTRAKIVEDSAALNLSNSLFITILLITLSLII
jgi:hypothetical protein